MRLSFKKLSAILFIILFSLSTTAFAGQELSLMKLLCNKDIWNITKYRDEFEMYANQMPNTDEFKKALNEQYELAAMASPYPYWYIYNSTFNNTDSLKVISNITNSTAQDFYLSYAPSGNGISNKIASSIGKKSANLLNGLNNSSKYLQDVNIKVNKQNNGTYTYSVIAKYQYGKYFWNTKTIDVTSMNATQVLSYKPELVKAYKGNLTVYGKGKTEIVVWFQGKRASATFKN